MKGKIDWDKIKLDPYEQEIEDNIEKAKRVENFEEWKAFVERAAAETVKWLESRKVRFVVEAPSPEVKEEVIKLLKERFGEALKVEG